MSSRSKQIGTRWESAICSYLNGYLGYEHPASWQYIKRVVQNGARDLGDIHAWPLVIEAKDCKSKAVPTWLRQAETEAINAGFPYSVVAVRIRGKGPALARVHISDETYARLLSADGMWEATPPIPNSRGYWTWDLATFADVLRIVRAATPPPT